MIEEEGRREESEKTQEWGEKNGAWNEKRDKDNAMKRVLHGNQNVASVLTSIICGRNFEDWGEGKKGNIDLLSFMV